MDNVALQFRKVPPNNLQDLRSVLIHEAYELRENFPGYQQFITTENPKDLPHNSTIEAKKKRLLEMFEYANKTVNPWALEPNDLRTDGFLQDVLCETFVVIEADRLEASKLDSDYILKLLYPTHDLVSFVQEYMGGFVPRDSHGNLKIQHRPPVTNPRTRRMSWLHTSLKVDFDYWLNQFSTTFFRDNIELRKFNIHIEGGNEEGNGEVLLHPIDNPDFAPAAPPEEIDGSQTAVRLSPGAQQQ